MAQKDKDELADALKRMSRGEAGDDSDDAQPSESAALDIPQAPRQRPSRPMTRAAAVPKPDVPKSGKARPAAPSASPTPPSARQQISDPAPSAAPPGTTEMSDEISSSLANVVDDSELSVTFQAITTGPKIEREPARQARSFQLRRTMIPVLLTLGVCLPLIAAWWFSLDADAPARETGIKFPLALLAIGAVMLVLAVANMLSVRQELARNTPR